MWTLNRATGEISHHVHEDGVPGHPSYVKAGPPRLVGKALSHPDLLPAGEWAFHHVPNAWGMGHNVVALYDITMRHQGRKFIIHHEPIDGFEPGSLIVPQPLVHEMARAATIKPTRFSVGDKILRVTDG